MDSVVTLIFQHNGPHTGGAAATGDAAGGGMPAGMHTMSPFLFTRSTKFFVLFESAFINSTGGFVGVLLLSFLFALIATIAGQVIRLHENLALAKGRFVFRIASVLHGVRQLLHYVVMLIVMTMNVSIIIAVAVCHAVGWLIYSVFLHNKLNKRVPDAPDGKAADFACDC